MKITETKEVTIVLSEDEARTLQYLAYFARSTDPNYDNWGPKSKKLFSDLERGLPIGSGTGPSLPIIRY